MLAVAVLHFICLKQAHAKESELIQQIEDSGRCATVAESHDTRTGITFQIAPGQPPILTFRYYEGKSHHRFGNSDLMLDDAGH